jgi:hypothetical protein
MVEAVLVAEVLEIECMLVARDKVESCSPLELTGGAADASIGVPGAALIACVSFSAMPVVIDASETREGRPLPFEVIVAAGRRPDRDSVVD